MAIHFSRPLLSSLTIAAVAVLAFTTPSHAQPAPGDSCNTFAAGTTTLSAGPEDAGEGYELVCDGSVWQSVLEFVETSGRVRLNFGNDQGDCETEKTGRMRYDDGDDLWEYCDGEDWQQLAEQPPEPVILPDPVAHYPLDEGAGLSATDTVAANNGTLTNMAGSEWVAGKDGGALSFDGSNDYVDIPTHVFPLGASPRTFSLWVKLNSTASQMDILLYGVASSGNRVVIAANRDGAGSLSFAANGGRIKSSGTLTTGAWRHVTVVFPVGTANVMDLIIYVNGVATTNTLSSGSNVAINTLTTAATFSASSAPVNGAIDDVRMYDVALTPQQVLALYSSYP